MPGSTYEPILNYRLSELLRSGGLDVTAEPLGSGQRRIDVRVQVDGMVIALEGEKGTRAGALKDAQQRLDQAGEGVVLVDRVVAINYPRNLNVDDFDERTTFEWATLPNRDFVSGTSVVLRDALHTMPQDHGDASLLVNDIDQALERAVEVLHIEQIRDLARSMNLPLRHKGRDRSKAAAKRALLVVLAASMFHARLDNHLSDTQPDIDAKTGKPFDGPWPPTRIRQCVGETDIVGALEDAWDSILALDYGPIFTSALTVLAAPAQIDAWGKAIASVVNTALRASRDPAGLRQDLLGRIFHRLLDSARYDGSYYTSTPAAMILAWLAIRQSHLPQNLSDYKLIDPACGTGTLLMAATERIRSLQDSSEDDAKKLIEDVVWGLDINVTACHMAATALGLVSPSSAFSDMHIHMMPLEVSKEKGQPVASVGSLELLDQSTSHRPVDWTQGAQSRMAVEWTRGEQIDSGTGTVAADPHTYDLVIMNPPYTRNDLRYDQFSPEDERAISKREGELVKGRGAHRASGGTSFAVLAQHLGKFKAGSTVALVLPLVGSSNVSGAEVRRLLAQQFHIETVIASHDPSRFYFSENTDISEMLVIARRHEIDEPTERPDTKFVLLTRNPGSSHDAVTLASKIANIDEFNDGSIGVVDERCARDMVKGNWRPMAMLSSYLVDVGTRVASSQLFPVVEIGQLVDLPSSRNTREYFTAANSADRLGRRGLWCNNTTFYPSKRLGRNIVTNVPPKISLESDPDVYVHAKPNQVEQANDAWQRRASLFLCNSIDTTNARVIATRTPSPAVTSTWQAFSLSESELNAEEWEKSMCVWFNSSLGVVSSLNIADPFKLPRPQFSVDGFRSLPVPLLGAQDVKRLASVFNTFNGSEIQALAQVENDPVRLAIDDAIQFVLGVDPELMATVRHELAREPAVTNRRYGQSA